MRIVRDADPSLPLAPARTLDAVVDVALAPRAARFGLVGVFALGAALLGIVGLSSALIRSVVERQRELAIRAAVGASPRRLLADVMRDGALLTGLGVALGLGLSALLARAVSAIIFGVAPRDPLTYGVTAAAGIRRRACRLLPAGPSRRRLGSGRVAPRRVAAGHRGDTRSRHLPPPRLRVLTCDRSQDRASGAAEDAARRRLT